MTFCRHRENMTAFHKAVSPKVSEIFHSRTKFQSISQQLTPVLVNCGRSVEWLGQFALRQNSSTWNKRSEEPSGNFPNKEKTLNNIEQQILKYARIVLNLILLTFPSSSFISRETSNIEHSWDPVVGVSSETALIVVTRFSATRLGPEKAFEKLWYTLPT